MAPTLPEQQSKDAGKPTLVLDLDNTLVSVSALPSDFEDGDDLTPYVTRRPGLENFLKDMSERYEIVIFSASGSLYVKQIVRSLDPEGDMISGVLTGKDTDWVSGQVVKDLRKLGRDLNKVVWVDDNASLYVYNSSIGIQVPAFNGDPTDNVLQGLGVRIERKFKLEP